MKPTLEEKVGEARSLIDVLLLLKETTMLDIHCATLAYVQRKKKQFDGICSAWDCKPFPLNAGQGEYTTEAYCFSKDANFSEGDIALMIFADLDFLPFLDAASKSPMEARSQITHSQKYAVIIWQGEQGLTEAERKELTDI